jgi:PAS domain S-box-containing protein
MKKNELTKEELLLEIENLKKLLADKEAVKQRLKDNESRFRSIVEDSQAGYFFIDNEGLFQKVNKAWLNLYQYNDFEEVLGRHFADVQQLDDIESAKEFVENIKNGNPEFMNGEFNRKCKNGSTGFHSFSARPVYIQNSFVGIEGFIIDITKQKEAELELLKANEIIERNEKNTVVCFFRCKKVSIYTN